MNVAVRYYSKTGNTKKIAQAISEAAGAPAHEVSEPLNGYVDLLLLGSAVYAGGVGKPLRAFIDLLDPEKVGCVAVFSTTALEKSSYAEIKELLEHRGIKVSDRNFHCKGRFALMHRKHPDADDMAKAAEFVRELVNT